MSIHNKFDAVLFDLDGTLLDTAPDFVTSLNKLLRQKDCPPLPDKIIRATVSHGARALVTLGFGLDETDTRFEPLRQELLVIYRQHLSQKTRLFSGMAEILCELAARNIPWGIVTNKPEIYTTAILADLVITPAPSVIICPDHVSKTKPNPEALFLACSKVAAQPERSVYIGDHPRDIQAGLNAGLTTIAVSYGYLEAGDNPGDWGAHHLVHRPQELAELLF